eukprot:6037409-Prymnesium_polylepis.1
MATQWTDREGAACECTQRGRVGHTRRDRAGAFRLHRALACSGRAAFGRRVSEAQRWLSHANSASPSS